MNIENLYKSLPTIVCKKKCQASCGPIICGEKERAYQVEKLGVELFPPNEDTFKGVTEGSAPHVCQYLRLEDGLCGVHEHRPMMCRLYGLAKAMACPHGCVPTRWLKNKKIRELMMRAGVKL